MGDVDIARVQEELYEETETRECPYCEEDNLTRRELTIHACNEHSDEVNNHFFFFEAYKDSYNQRLYMLVSDAGKSFLYYSKDDRLEEATEWSKFFHDWENVVYEDTPFTKFDEIIES
jgi:ribosomal protein L37AE/L43A